MSSPADFVTDYAAVFNAAVGSGDYAPLLARFTDHAVLRFENVPPPSAAIGRQAYSTS